MINTIIKYLMIIKFQGINFQDSSKSVKTVKVASSKIYYYTMLEVNLIC